MCQPLDSETGPVPDRAHTHKGGREGNPPDQVGVQSVEGMPAGRHQRFPSRHATAAEESQLSP